MRLRDVYIDETENALERSGERVIMKRLNSCTPRLGMLQISVKPGLPAIQLMAAAITRSIGRGAGLISMKHFPWPDLQMLPGLVHPRGKSLAHAYGRRRA